jgi:hypothetical protein
MDRGNFGKGRGTHSISIQGLWVINSTAAEFYQLFLPRIQNQGKRGSPNLDKYSFTTEQMQFIEGWVRKQIDLVN